MAIAANLPGKAQLVPAWTILTLLAHSKADSNTTKVLKLMRHSLVEW